MAETPDQRPSLVEQAQDELVCPICTDFFVRPRSLICLHSFCENCLVQLWRVSGEQETLTCPECRAKTSLSDEAVAGLPVNFKLGRLVEILSATDKQIIRQSTYRKKSSPRCSLHHDKPLEYYCEHCRALICGQCMLDEHKQHDHVHYATKVVPKHLEILRGFLPIADGAAKRVQDTMNTLKADNEAILRAKDDTVQSVRSYFGNLRQILTKREEEIVGDVCRLADEKAIVVAKRHQVLEEAYKNISKYGKSINDMINRRGTDIRVLLEEDTITAMLLSQVQVIEAETKQAINQRQLGTQISFVPDPTFEELCQSAGAKVRLRMPPSPLTTRSRSRAPTAAKYNFTQQPSPKPYLERSRSDSVESTATEYSEPLSRNWSFQELDEEEEAEEEEIEEERYVPTMRPTTRTFSHPPTPPVRRELHEYEAEICVPELEITAKNLSGSFFKTMTKEIFPCGVSVNINNTIVATDVRNHCFSILAPTGRCLEVVGSEGKGNGQFFEPTAVMTDKEGNILVADKDPPRIQKFSQNGKFILRFSLRSPLRGTHLGEPWGIAVSFDGKVLVSDWDKSCIHIFDESGKYMGNFGSANVTTALKYPAGIAIDKRGQVVVADRGNHCIWRFTPDGQPLSRFGKQGHAPGELFFPFGVAIDKEGNIIVSESGNHRISFFTANGKFLRCFGKKGTQPGMFQYPRHLCIDQQGRLVVADELNQRLQIFSV